MTWGLDQVHEDPGEVLLRLVSQSAARAQRYAAELAELVDSEGLNNALLGTVRSQPSTALMSQANLSAA
jgi:hypothetical protein